MNQSSLILSADRFVSFQVFTRELGTPHPSTNETTTVVSGGVQVSRRRPLTSQVRDLPGAILFWRAPRLVRRSAKRARLVRRSAKREGGRLASLPAVRFGHPEFLSSERPEEQIHVPSVRGLNADVFVPSGERPPAWPPVDLPGVSGPPFVLFDSEKSLRNRRISTL